eukprot:CAMPEP_0115286712 /NCGR_PEP_ID=MMETSP0270-20121206/62078_1 /TAXON_ID=71861 /ORGANISM="Scrippsiella trochoidea, Strain CCMP3099" /LENGTH=63 /DNA_ID=CAMNT_0002703755 /DNA_START=173 /DNA_END=360 /DNA_ORIENTATION=-
MTARFTHFAAALASAHGVSAARFMPFTSISPAPLAAQVASGAAGAITLSPGLKWRPSTGVTRR